MNTPPGAAKLLSKFRGAATSVVKGAAVVGGLTALGAAIGAAHGYNQAQYGLKWQGSREGAREGAVAGATVGAVTAVAGKKIVEAGKVVFRRVRGRVIPIKA